MTRQVLFKLDEEKRVHPFGQETVFEPQRGITKVELDEGYVQVIVYTDDINEALDSLVEEGCSFHYLKLLSKEISFIVDEEHNRWSLDEVIKNLSILKIHAANLREEDGLVAHILEIASRMDIEINHISDVHNCLTLVLDKIDAKKLCQEVLKTDHEN